jgi:nitroreductase
MMILESARQCQSGKNAQPWYFITIEKRETLDKLAELMKGDVDEELMKKSSLAVAIIGDPAKEFYVFDCGRAAQNMTLAAWELGVGSCVISGPEPPDRESYRVKAGRLLNVPNNLRFLELMIFGYPKVKKTVRTKRRKTLQDLVFKEEFGHTMSG